MRNILKQIFLFAALSASDIPFKSGEKLYYIAEWNGVKVGKAELSIALIEKINNKNVYHIIFSTETSGWARRLFKIKDKIEVWIDEKEFYTYRLKKNIQQLAFRENIDVFFDYKKGIAKTNNKEIKINFKARDPYSMFYYLRTLELKNNDPMTFSSYEGKKIVKYNLMMTGKEKIRSPFGKISCKVIRPFNQNGVLFKNKGAMQIWISDDKQRFPIKIELKMKFGRMTLLLRKTS